MDIHDMIGLGGRMSGLPEIKMDCDRHDKKYFKPLENGYEDFVKSYYNITSVGRGYSLDA
jgi:hypothetical protein